jgi:hypothetical protein
MIFELANQVFQFSEPKRTGVQNLGSSGTKDALLSMRDERERDSVLILHKGWTQAM